MKQDSFCEFHHYYNYCVCVCVLLSEVILTPLVRDDPSGGLTAGRYMDLKHSGNRW